MDQEKVDQISEMINGLIKKYGQNLYMIQRLETHFKNLPNMLELENKKYDDRVSRFNELTLERDNFHKVFLSKHQYFYMPYNNIYYEYDGKTYKIVKDDDIHHNLLSTITDEGKLIQWKHKTKLTIIKTIKERSLFKTTPETYTIQNVLGFLQTIFQTKQEAKYFLTVIGDCLLKKNTDNLLYFVSSNVKKLVTMIDSIGYITTGNSIMNNFITKYHDTHKLNLYRLIKKNESANTLSHEILKNVLNNIGVDLLCVAAHYSIRYGSSDEYLIGSCPEELIDSILYLKDRSPTDMVQQFMREYLQIDQDVSGNSVSMAPTITTNAISWKNMQYLWKHFLDSKNLPSVIFQNNLKSILIEKLVDIYKEETDTFIGICSKHLPIIQRFILFWEDTITYQENEFDNEFEIDEICILFK
jgi:hypothetical protein